MKRKTIFIYLILIGICTILLLSYFPYLRENGKKKLSEQQVLYIQADYPGTTNNYLDYDFIPLPQLIGMASLAVIGEVTEIEDSTFKFRIEKTLSKGQCPNLLTVRKFIPSKFDEPRQLPYSVEQRFVLFLLPLKDDNSSQLWEIIGFAGEGEMPIDQEYVYFKSFYLQGLENKQYQVRGTNSTFQRFNLTSFIDAVQNYYHCFSWKLEVYVKNNKERKRWVSSINCTSTTVGKYQATSWLHEYLVNETLKNLSD